MDRSGTGTAFRDETTPPRRSAHDVLTDAVDLYLRAPSHDRDEIAAFSALVGGLLDGADPIRRRKVAMALAPRPDAPPDIVRRLARDTIEIAETMILHSPVLTSKDFVAVMLEGADHVRCVARRLGLAADAALALIDANTAPMLLSPIDATPRRRDEETLSRKTTIEDAFVETAPIGRYEAHRVDTVEIVDIAAENAAAELPPPLDEAPAIEERTAETAAPVDEPAPEVAPAASVPFFDVAPRQAAPQAAPKAAAEAEAGEAAPRNRLPGLSTYLRLDSSARWRALQNALLDATIRSQTSRPTKLDPGLLGDRLLTAIAASDRAFAAAALAEHLGLPSSLVEEVMHERSGEVLALLLVAGGIGETRATSILLHHLGPTATLGALQDLVALVERTPRRSAEWLVTQWREEHAARRNGALRQTVDAERREAAGRARETGVREAPQTSHGVLGRG